MSLKKAKSQLHSKSFNINIRYTTIKGFVTMALMYKAGY